MFVVVAIILAFCENADSYKNIQFNITRTDVRDEIVYECSQSSTIYTILEDQTAQLSISVPATISNGWCQYKNTNAYIVNSFTPHRYDYSYTEKILEAEISNVDSTLGTYWTCTFAVRNNIVTPTCTFKVHVRRLKGPVIKINDEEILTKRGDVSMIEYDFYSFYAIDGRQNPAEVVCTVDNKQGLKLRYYNNQTKSDPYRDFDGFINILEIGEKVNLLGEYTNNSYIECSHRTAEDVTVVRVIFIRYDKGRVNNQSYPVYPPAVAREPKENPSRNIVTTTHTPKSPSIETNTSTNPENSHIIIFPRVVINQQEISYAENIGANYFRRAIYHYVDEQLTDIECIASNRNGLKYQYVYRGVADKGRPVTTSYINETAINIQTILKAHRNNSYLECIHRIAENTTVAVRIVFILKPEDFVKDQLYIRVNGLKLGPDHKYIYAEGEKVTATCEKNIISEGTLKFETNLPLNIANNSTWTLENTDYKMLNNISKISFVIPKMEKFVKGVYIFCHLLTNSGSKSHLKLFLEGPKSDEMYYVHGLLTQNILFRYKQAEDITEIQYQYEDKDHLELFFGVTPQAGFELYSMTLTHEDKVQWNNTVTIPSTAVTQNGNTVYNYTIVLLSKHNGSIIKYSMNGKSLTNPGIAKIVLIILRMKPFDVPTVVTLPNRSSNTSTDETDNGTSEAIIIACVACVMIAIIVIIIYWKFKNYKRNFNEVNHACYVNLSENECSIQAIPPKCNEYSEPLNNNDDVSETYAVIHNKTDCMYTIPLPKCQRTVNTSEYSNTSGQRDLGHTKGDAKLVDVDEVVAYAEVVPKIDNGNGGTKYANVCTGDRYVNTEGNEYAEPAYSLPVIKD